MSIAISSTAFTDNAPIPTKYTCSGQDLSPPLAWSGIPTGAQSFAVICEDPDAPGGTFYHWGVYNLPASVTGLTEGAKLLPQGAKTAQNSFGSGGYRGPCPPKGHGIHHYHFRFYALSVREVSIDGSANCRKLLAALQPHVMASCDLIGTFER